MKQVTGKRWHGQFEVEYAGFNPPVYLHKLLPGEYGQNWMVVARPE